MQQCAAALVEQPLARFVRPHSIIMNIYTGIIISRFDAFGMKCESGDLSCRRPLLRQTRATDGRPRSRCRCNCPINFLSWEGGPTEGALLSSSPLSPLRITTLYVTSAPWPHVHRTVSAIRSTLHRLNARSRGSERNLVASANALSPLPCATSATTTHSVTGKDHPRSPVVPVGTFGGGAAVAAAAEAADGARCEGGEGGADASGKVRLPRNHRRRRTGKPEGEGNRCPRRRPPLDHRRRQGRLRLLRQRSGAARTPRRRALPPSRPVVTANPAGSRRCRRRRRALSCSPSSTSSAGFGTRS